jgi:hypothetical protein
MSYRILSSNTVVPGDIPRVQTPKLKIYSGELIEICIFANTSTSNVVPNPFPGITWSQLAILTNSDSFGALYVGIATEDVDGYFLSFSYSSSERIGWVVTARSEYAGGNNGQNAYLQEGISRGQSSVTFSSLNNPQNSFFAAIASFGPLGMQISVSSNHEEIVDHTSSGGNYHIDMATGTDTTISFSQSLSPWLQNIIIYFELVSGTDGYDGYIDGYEYFGIGTPINNSVWFNGGHSLLDQPLNSYMEMIANYNGQNYDWQRQYIIGSTIDYRTQFDNNWAGYSLGDNRGGNNLNLINHFRNPIAEVGKRTNQPYTHLIIGEGHGLSLTASGLRTIPLIRHFYELIREGSPNCIGYVFPTWLDYDVNRIQQWIHYLRHTDLSHAAVVRRINASLEYESRSDRLINLPICKALAELLDRAIYSNVPGITQGTIQDTLNVIFSDTVHVTSLGMYFVSCVVYASIYRRDPRGAVYPSIATAQQAEQLQNIAWDVVLDTYGEYPYLGDQLTDGYAQQVMVDHVSIMAPFANGVVNVSQLESFFAGTQSDMWFSPPQSEDLWYARPPGAVFDSNFTLTWSNFTAVFCIGSEINGEQ